MNAYWEWRYSSIHSLTSVLDGSEWSALRHGRFTPTGTAPRTHWIGGWVGPRAILDMVVKSPRRESNPRTPIVQPVAQRYTDTGSGAHPASYPMGKRKSPCAFFNLALRHEGVLRERKKSSTHSWPLHWMEVSGHLHSPAALPKGKSPYYPLDRRLGGPQIRSGRGGE
jgi:hypothetical protein